MNLNVDLHEKKKAFIQLLSEIEIDTISFEPYCKKYLSYLISHKEYFLDIYSDLFEKLIAHTSVEKEKIIVVDYGAGNGLLGIFGKYCGFKKIYINDTDQKFIAAAKELSFQLKIPIDGFIHGDAKSLTSYFQTEKPDVIIGTDVIEHIYDLQEFFYILKILNPDIISFFTTASNPYNFFKVRQLKKLHVKDELYGGTPDDTLLFGESAHGAYLKMREDIIRNNFQLPEAQIKSLAVVTRGLVEEDIITAVLKNLETGIMPEPANHPTNTCHPLTGSWTERILTINEYTYIYNAAGFHLNLFEGFYDIHKQLGKKMINKFLNAGVKIFGKTLAPYIILAGSKK